LHQLMVEPSTSWSVRPVAVSTSSVLFANPELSGFVAIYILFATKEERFGA